MVWYGMVWYGMVWGDSHMLPSRGVRVWVVYLTPKIERIIVLLSASPEGEARLPMPKGMAYKDDYYYYYYYYYVWYEMCKAHASVVHRSAAPIHNMSETPCY
jgi:hypothetical protein